MFRTLERLHMHPSEMIFTHILTNHLQNLDEFHSPFRRFFQRYIDEREDEQYKEEKTNDNFKKQMIILCKKNIWISDFILFI